MKCRASVVMVVGLGLAWSARAQVTFTPIADLPGGAFYSRPYAISRDGATVVGESDADSDPLHEAFRWSHGVVSVLPQPAPTPDSGAGGWAFCISDVGVVAGMAAFLPELEPAIFHPTHVIALATPQDESSGLSTGGLVAGLSADARVAVGGHNSTVVFEYSRAAVWTDSVLTTLPFLEPGDNDALARGVSADGRVVVGFSGVIGGVEAYRRPFVWAESAGLRHLLDPSMYGAALGISRDGRIIVGSTSGNTPDDSRYEAFRWTELDGLVLLGGANSLALGVSDDGGVIVGAAHRDTTLDGACIWTRTSGLRLVSDILSDAGIRPIGWTFAQTRGVSGDGRTITGWGINPAGNEQGWIIRLGTTPNCPADLDDDGEISDGGNPDGGVTIEDLIYFVSAFALGDASADLDDDGTDPATPDGGVTIDDLLFFLTHFEAGC